MRNRNAIVMFARTHEVTRAPGDDPFSSLPWEELDSVLHSCAADVLHAAAAVPGTDVLLFRSPQFPAARLPVPAGDAVRDAELGAGEFGDLAQHALESAFLEDYQRVVVVLENNPLPGRAFFPRAFDLLAVEDDCAVIVPTEESGVVMAGFKAAHPALFGGRGGQHHGGGGRLLRRLCELDMMVVPSEPSFMLDTTAAVERLRAELSNLDPASPDYPKRTGALFRSLEKKYRWRKPPG